MASNAAQNTSPGLVNEDQEALTPTPTPTDPTAAAGANTDTNTNTNAHAVDSDSFHPGSGGSQHAPALPAPGSTDAVRLDLSGENGGQVRLDALGPMVVNQDGSLSRIANWDRMAEIEKRNTLRILGKRNQARLEALRARGEGEERK